MLLHRLEHRRLGLGRSAVDLVGEQQIGEDRARLKYELFFARSGLLKHRAAEDVARQQIGRELDPFEIEHHQFAERLDERGLADAGKPLKEDVPAAQNTDEQQPVEPVLAEQDPIQLVDDPVRVAGSWKQFFGGGGRRHRITHFFRSSGAMVVK